jgi:mono/diheme cytochrome c family protein
MPTSPPSPATSSSRPPRAPIVFLAAAVVLVATGCGAVAHMTATEGNAPAGQKLFQDKCGSCHIMENAGTTGTLGPNLDSTFGIVRAQGFHESTIRDVVRGQIAYAETETATGGPGMPANLVEGQDADDVAQYVAQCAGVPDCDLTGDAP